MSGMKGDSNEEIGQDQPFRAFKTFAWPTNRPTDQPTDQWQTNLDFFEHWDGAGVISTFLLEGCVGKGEWQEGGGGGGQEREEIQKLV